MKFWSFIVFYSYRATDLLAWRYSKSKLCTYCTFEFRNPRLYQFYRRALLNLSYDKIIMITRKYIYFQELRVTDSGASSTSASDVYPVPSRYETTTISRVTRSSVFVAVWLCARVYVCVSNADGNRKAGESVESRALGYRRVSNLHKDETWVLVWGIGVTSVWLVEKRFAMHVAFESRYIAASEKKSKYTWTEKKNKKKRK